MNNIYAYNQHSKSAKALSEAIGWKRIRHNNSNYTGDPDKFVVNWGASKLPEEVMKSNIINDPQAVALTVDKLKFLRHMSNFEHINIPEFTTDSKEAIEWINQGHTVFCRTDLRGHSGKGIYIVDRPDNFVNAPLYVKYIKKKDEYRVHVLDGAVIGVRRKALKSGKMFKHSPIRSFDNGYIFQKNNIQAPDDVISQSVDTVGVCGLDFGAVDVILNEFYKRATVLEVNTAPGLEGSTVKEYAAALDEYLAGKKGKIPLPEHRHPHMTIEEYAELQMEKLLNGEVKLDDEF